MKLIDRLDKNDLLELEGNIRIACHDLNYDSTETDWIVDEIISNLKTTERNLAIRAGVRKNPMVYDLEPVPEEE